LPAEADAEEFAESVKSVLSELESGKAGYYCQGHDLIHNLIRKKHTFYEVLEVLLPEVLRTVCPADFARDVEDCYAIKKGK